MAKKKLDAETRRKLLGLMPVSNNFVVEYVPSVYKDIPDEFKPVFQIKPWTQSELKKLSLIGEDVDKATDELRRKIVGWKNVILMDDDSEVAFETDEKGFCKKELLDSFPMMVLVDILKEITRISGAAIA